MSSASTTLLRVSDMTCNHCSRTVIQAIQSTAGVQSATVSLSQKTAVVRWQTGQPKNVAAVLAAIGRSGFQAEEIGPGAEVSAGDLAGPWPWHLIPGLAVTLALMAGEWGGGLMLQPWFQWTAFFLAGAVQVFAGAPFYRGAWNQLKAGSSNMDTLVALGSSTAFGYSAWALWFGGGGHLYFLESSAIISLIGLGHWLEARVGERAGHTLKSLMQLAPALARKLAVPQATTPAKAIGGFNLRTLAFESGAKIGGPEAVEIEVPVSELSLGDRVVLRPGDRVPVDGRVLEGNSAVDESMLTGEAMPVEKQSASEVFAGTLNLNGRLVMEATATGETTALARVIAAVERAQSSRAQIQRLGDRISSVFVPVITLTAVGAGLVWGFAPQIALQGHAMCGRFLWSCHLPAAPAAGFIIAAGVLIVACPCAMGLATPAAIMAAANAAARRGILIRDGVALEKAGRITAVLFDKTGTLTAGRPKVQATLVFGDRGRFATDLAAALARHSNHPNSRAIATLSGETVAMEGWQEIQGSGVQAITKNSGPVRLGSPRWLGELGVDLAPGEAFTAEWTAQGATLVGLAVQNHLAALFALQDPVKPDAAAAVAGLRRQSLKVYLVTGDHACTANAMARLTGIAVENVFAGVRPEDKAALVRKLQAQGERVAFVGDGINDAPALSQADLGIAVSRASDLAREAADLSLLKADLAAVPECLGLARATLRVIQQNLFWAFFYNALAVPLAALGFVSPVCCALCMGASDLLVIGNALRLLRWKHQKSFSPPGFPR